MNRIALSLLWIPLLCVAALATAQVEDKPPVDVSGTWKTEVAVAGQTGAPVFTLTQEGTKLTGKYRGTFGEHDVTGAIKGNEVDWAFITDQGEISYFGTLVEDSIKGTVMYGDLEETWTAKRQPAAEIAKVDTSRIVGRWKIVEAPEPFLKDATLELTIDGSMSFTLSVFTLEGRYEVSGRDLKLTMKGPDQKEKTEAHRIQKLSDTALELNDSNGKVTKYARAQAVEITRTQDVIYGRKYGVALTMDVFAPRKGNGRGIIWCVSGGWQSSKESVNPAVATPFLERGYTVFQVVHGSQPKFTIPEVLEDMHRAVRFVRANASKYAIEPDRLGIAGLSAGGHLSLMQGCAPMDGNPDSADPVERQSSRIAAVACFVPPTDFLNYGKPGETALGAGILKDYKAPFDFHVFDSRTKAFVQVTDEAKRLEIGRKISPVNFVSEHSPPTLIIHGDADELVPIQQSELMIAKLKEQNVPCELVVKKGAGHVWLDIYQDLETVANWFDRHLPGPK